MPGMDVEQLNVSIIANSNIAVSEIGKLIDSLEKLNGTSLDKVSKSFQVFRNASLKISGGAGGAARTAQSFTTRLAFAIGKFRQIFFMAKRVASVFSNMTESAMDYVEVLNYFNAAFDQVASRSVDTFGDAGEESGKAFANRFAAEAEKLTEQMSGYKVTESGMVTNTLGTTLGMNPATMMNYQATFAQMASSMGVSSDMAVDLSRALTEIGADLASVKNMDFEDTWANLQSGLVGMSRAVDKFGVNIRNVNLQQKLTDLGIEANIQSMNQQDKALLRTIIILENSQYAWGDLADTINQPANQMRMLRSGFDNLSRTLGNLFLPIVASVLPYVNALVVALQKMVELLVASVGIEFDWGSSGGAMIDSEWADYMDDTADSFGKATEAAEEWKNQILGFDEINKLGSEDSGDTDASANNPLVTGQLEGALRDALSNYQKVWDASYENVNNRVNEMAQRIVDAFQEGDFKKIGRKISDWIVDGLEGIDWEEVKKFAYDFGANFADFLNGFITPELFSTVGKTLAQTLNTVVQRALGFGENFDWSNFGESVGTGISDFLLTFDFGALVQAFNAFVRGFATALTSALRTIKWTDILANVINGMLKIDPIALTIFFGGITFKSIANNAIGMAGNALKGVLSAALSKAAPLFGAASTLTLGLGGLALGVGLVIAIDKIITNVNEKAFQSFYSSIAPVASTLDEATKGLSEFKTQVTSEFGDTTGYVDTLNELKDRFWELSEKESLTNDEMAELQRLNAVLVKEVPGFSELVDTQSGIFKGTREELDKLVDAQERYYVLQATSGILEEYAQKQAEVGLKMFQTKQEIDKLRPAAEAYNELIANKSAYSAETWYTAINDLIAAHSDLGIETEEDLEKISRSYATAQGNLDSYQREWDDVTKQIDTIKQYTRQVTTEMGTVSNSIGTGLVRGINGHGKEVSTAIRDIGNKHIISPFRDVMQIQSPSKVMEQLGNYTVQGLAKGLGNTGALTQPLTNLRNAITGAFDYNNIRPGLQGIVTAFSNVFADAGQASINQYNTMTSKLNTARVNGKPALSLTKVPHMYANGGFPEDGFFFANSTEMVGRFANGRTAVANNEQIIQGIEGGVARGMAQALMSSASVTGGQNGQPVQVVINVDSETLYRTTLRGQNKYNSRYHLQLG